MSTDTLLLCLVVFLPLHFSFFSEQHTSFCFLNSLPLPKKAVGSLQIAGLLLLPEKISGLVRVNAMTQHIYDFVRCDFTVQGAVKINEICKVKRAHPE